MYIINTTLLRFFYGLIFGGLLFAQTNAWSASLPDQQPLNLETNDRLNVVASFSILGDLIRVLGGPHVEVVTLVGADNKGHTYQPTPADGRRLASANLVVINGLYFEGWIPRLIDSTGYRAPLVVATEGVDVIHINGEPDPHAWQSLSNILIYADKITQALVQLLPDSSSDLLHRNQQFQANVANLYNTARRLFNRIAVEDRKIVTSHDAFGYFGREFAIQFISPVGMSTDELASAKDIAQLIRQIKTQNIRAMFVETISNPRLLEQIASETGVAIGGVLYSDSLSQADGPAASYLDMMRHNIESIWQVLATQENLGSL
jgi:zinc/manganese transport system substrate-binding protein